MSDVLVSFHASSQDGETKLDMNLGRAINEMCTSCIYDPKEPGREHSRLKLVLASIAHCDRLDHQRIGIYIRR